MALKSRQKRKRGMVLMTIIWPTHSEPVLPDIPDEEIYEDED